LNQIVDDFNTRVTTAPLPTGFIEQMYTPRDDHRNRFTC
jgi:hypothetical protein